MSEPTARACPSCNGKGGDSSGPCWDCRGGRDEPTRQDVDALADVIARMYGSPTDPDDHLPDHCRAMARAILTSDWLARRDERTRRGALNDYADHIMADVAKWDERVYPNRWSNAREKANAARDRAAMWEATT